MAIYFIQCGTNGPIKIGYSSNPIKRLMGMQVDNPILLTLICFIEGERKDEAELHSKFKSDKIMGEWFNPSHQLIEFISEFTHVNITVNKGRELQNNSGWKGEAARIETKRARVQRRYKSDICEKCGAPGFDRVPKDGYIDNLSADNIIIMCRKCCMKNDGRLDKFIEMAKASKNHLKKDDIECRICKITRKHHSHGRCKACDEFFRRKGIERPISVILNYLHKIETAALRKRLAASKGNGGISNYSSNHDDDETPQ